MGTNLYARAVASGVQVLANTEVTVHEIMFGDGGSSVSLAHKNPMGDSKIVTYGGKFFPYANQTEDPVTGMSAAGYRINTLLIFDAAKPRETTNN